MQVRLFGATIIATEDEHPVTAPRQRAVLARLALNPGKPVSADQLLNDVWGEDLPSGGQKAVAFQITKLRNLIEPERSGPGTVITTDTAGYRLHLGPEDVDIHKFERLVHDARDALEDPSKARALIEDALGMWRGPPLADIDEQDWVTFEIRRLEEVRQLAQHTAAQARMAMGEYVEAAGELEVLIHDRQLDEGLVADLMKALQAVGRSSDALRAYGELRQRLANELGMDPSGDLKALEQQILLGQAPMTGANAASAGKTNIAERLDSFVGRQSEIESVAQSVENHRLVTIVGTGGNGKTRLATHLGLALVDRYTNGVRLVQLAPVTDSEQIVHEIATTLGLRAGEGATLLEVLNGYLTSREILLIVDNCEHVLTSVAAVIQSLLQTAPGLSVLATSRETLGVPGEVVEHLAPLDLKAVNGHSEAAQLLYERGKATRADFDDVANAEGLIDSICNNLSGIPLGIELAAARLRTMSLTQLSSRLDSSLSSLGRSKSADPRQQTLDATIQWSVDLLESDERALFRKLSVFVGGFDLEAAEAVCGTNQTAEILDGLDQLVDKSLVESYAGPNATLRFRLVEPIRQFASRQLKEADEWAVLSGRHAQHYLNLTTEAEPTTRGHGQAECLRRLDTESNNISAALATLHRIGRLDDELDLCWNLLFYWRADAFQLLGVESILAALSDESIDGSGFGPRDRYKVARAWYECAHLALDNTIPESVDYAERGIEIARELGDDNLLARLLMASGCAIRNTTDRDDGVERLLEGERLYKAKPEPKWWDAHWEEAWYEWQVGLFGPDDHLGARVENCMNAIAVFREVGDDADLAYALALMMIFGFRDDNFRPLMEECLAEATVIAHRTGLRTMIGHCQYYNGLVAFQNDDPDTAIQSLSQAAPILGDIGDVQCHLHSSVALAAALTVADQWENAIPHLVVASAPTWSPEIKKGVAGPLSVVATATAIAAGDSATSKRFHTWSMAEADRAGHSRYAALAAANETTLAEMMTDADDDADLVAAVPAMTSFEGVEAVGEWLDHLVEPH